MPLWNLRVNPSPGALTLEEGEGAESWDKERCKTCGQGGLVSEGGPGGPGCTGRPLPCGL